MNGFFFNFVTVNLFKLYLGILFSAMVLLLPFQNIMAQQPAKKSCCSTEMSSNCCSSQHKKQSEKKQKSHSGACKDCCNPLQHCSGNYAFPVTDKLENTISPLITTDSKSGFHYQIPALYSLNFNIWQPPKIG